MDWPRQTVVMNSNWVGLFVGQVHFLKVHLAEEWLQIAATQKLQKYIHSFREKNTPPSGD